MVFSASTTNIDRKIILLDSDKINKQVDSKYLSSEDESLDVRRKKKKYRDKMKNRMKERISSADNESITSDLNGVKEVCSIILLNE